MKHTVFLSSPTMHGDEMKYIQEAFDTNWVAPLGHNVDAFEREICEKVGMKAACACCSGTAAMFLAYKLAGVGPGVKVFCSDVTFVATANPIVYLGGEPIFIDSEDETWNMSPEALEEAFRRHPDCKLVSMAYLYGTPEKMDELLAVCQRHGAVLIEDAAEALGASYHGKLCGSFGKYNALSFNGNKIITTSGGGMFLSDDEAAVKKAFFLSTQAREPYPWYEHLEVGYNLRMSNVVAGIGRGQLHYLEEHRDRKEALYHRYAEGLRELPISMNPYLSDTVPNFWLSCMLIDEGVGVKPMDVIERLDRAGIESRPLWKPMHMQPVYADRDFVSTGVGESIFARGLCLPSDIKMTAEQQQLVIDTVKSCF